MCPAKRPLSDTSPDAERALIELYRKASPEERLSVALDLSDGVYETAREGLRRANPGASEREIDLIYARVHFGREIAERFGGHHLILTGVMSRRLADALRPLIDAFNQLGVPYAVGGSNASAVYGIGRSTVDVDLLAALEERHVDPFVASLGEAYYADRETILEAVRTHGSFNVIFQARMGKIDVFVSAGAPYDLAELERARPATFRVDEDAFEAVVASAEDIVLRKLASYRLGGEVSERQWKDVQDVLQVQRTVIEAPYLRKWAPQLGVADLLERALAEVDLE